MSMRGNIIGVSDSPKQAARQDDPGSGERRRRKSNAERRSYTRRRAERTANAAHHRHRWTIDDAKTALDLTMTVPDAALQLGRTAAAIEGLRVKWRQGKLPTGLADQLPPPPRPTR